MFSVTAVSTELFLVTGSVVVTAFVFVVLNDLLPGAVVLSAAVEVMATWLHGLPPYRLAAPTGCDRGRGNLVSK
jgi:hypothetical protein